MDVRALKEYIFENQRIEELLTAIGCHHIRQKDGYYQCANKDGDNTSAICVYECENLTTVNYTRQMINGTRGTDLIDLVCYNEKLNFAEGLRFTCETLGLSYYHDFDAEVPDSFKFLQMLDELSSDEATEEERPLVPIDNSILDYYKPYVNDLFYNDGIDYQTQVEFGIGYDCETNHITIPIYSEINDLVGIKGRVFKEKIDKGENKYIYLIRCNKSQLLFGLNKSYEYILKKGYVIVVESEKGVLQCWSQGLKNVVATGGSKISRHQIELLTRLGVKILLCYDKDIEQNELEAIADRFMDGVKVYAIIDKSNILFEKESPCDNAQKMQSLLKNDVYMLKGG